MVARVLSPKRETVTKVESTVNNKDREEEALLHWLSYKISFHMDASCQMILFSCDRCCLNDNNLHH